MRPKALKRRHRGKSPNDLDFWQLHILAAKALLLLAFFWACLLLPDLRKTDGKEKKKRWCFEKWQSQYPSNTASSWSHKYQSCASMASCPAKPVHRAKGSSSGSCALWVTSILSPYSPSPPRYIFQSTDSLRVMSLCLLSDSGRFASPFQLFKGIYEDMILFLSGTVRSSSQEHLSIHIFKFYLTINILWILVLFWQFLVNISWYH